MKKKDLILAGAVLLLAGILALALRLPKTENGNTMKVTVDGEVYGTYSLAENQKIQLELPALFFQFLFWSKEPQADDPKPVQARQDH